LQKKTAVYCLLLGLLLAMESLPVGTEIQAQENRRIEKKPVWSPDMDRIAFEAIDFNDYIASQGQSIDEYNYDVWIMNSKGTGLANLTSQNPQYDAYPVWSPNGEFIAFLSKRSGNIDIWVMEANGSNPINLTANSPGDDLSPSWSPDGRFIAYIAENNKGVSYDVWIVEPDGNNPTKLTSEKNHIYGSITWSPDSSAVAYTNAVVNPKASDISETFEQFQPIGVWIATIDGKSLTALTPPRRDVDVAWSPQDGFLVTTVLDGLDSSIWLVSIDGTILTNLAEVTPNPDHFPIWSPDGDHIAFVSQRDNVLNSWDIWIMDADGSNAVNLTENFGFVNSEPSWSPDGTKITFTSNPPSNTSLGFDVDSDIWIMDADGSNKANLTGP
jgi:TolB protein